VKQNNSDVPVLYAKNGTINYKSVSSAGFSITKQILADPIARLDSLDKFSSENISKLSNGIDHGCHLLGKHDDVWRNDNGFFAPIALLAKDCDPKHKDMMMLPQNLLELIQIATTIIAEAFDTAQILIEI